MNIAGKRSRDNEEQSDSDCESTDAEDDLVVPVAKRSKKAIHTEAYEQWKASIIVSREALKNSASGEQCTILQLCCHYANFPEDLAHTSRDRWLFLLIVRLLLVEK